MACEAGEDFADFGAREHDGEPSRAMCPWELAEGADVFVEDFFIEEEDGIKGLVLGRGGGVEVLGDGGKEADDFGCAHKGGVFEFMEVDEAFDPIGICFSGSGAHMAEASSDAELVEEFRSFGEWGECIHGDLPDCL